MRGKRRIFRTVVQNVSDWVIKPNRLAGHTGLERASHSPLSGWPSAGLASWLELPKGSCAEHTASLEIRSERVRARTETTFLWWAADPCHACACSVNLQCFWMNTNANWLYLSGDVDAPQSVEFEAMRTESTCRYELFEIALEVLANHCATNLFKCLLSRFNC